MSNIEQLIEDLIKDLVNSLGFEIVQIKLVGTDFKVLKILIEKLDHSRLDVRDCSFVSYNISSVLDVNEVIKTKYHLEVSSAGIERPLVKEEDFSRFAGQVVSIKTHEVVDGKKNIKGKLLGLQEGKISIEDLDSKVLFLIEYSNIKSANIVLTEELFRQILNKKSS